MVDLFCVTFGFFGISFVHDITEEEEPTATTTAATGR
jgi:hypothetical protein